ncbi:flagellar hook-associated protein FlgK [Trinickia symbiotica]|uniref:Flagellar hook-associated protein 1 n=1 Tax=Trinickia symbiotica TaxID=863227 RepID=A0A2T3XNE2_9BURK|nr:flagellar hook-associated protein FlgK [Trinickia symbiotica]PTB18036.1 flagellar hook-associated protein FlgK [Trinickia symbiotica]
MSSSDIFGIGLSGLSAAQWGLTTAGNNISNASTAGYTVETNVYAESAGQYTGSGYFGSGVTTVTVQRNYSQYLSTELNNANSTGSALSANYSMASQLNNLVGSPTAGISAAISAYFTGLQNVANAPSNLANRQTAISDAQTLATQLNAAGQQYDQLRQSVNQQLTESVNQINSYTQQIAQLNVQIKNASSQGQPPNQLMDQRDQLVSQLSQQVGASVVQNSDGYSVFLSSGQPLVVANSSFDLGTSVSSGDPSELAVTYKGLHGATSASGSTQYLSDSTLSGGTVGGLLAFRSQTLDPAESQLGAIATSFAAQVNAQNALGIDLSGSAGGNLFTVASPTVYANLNNTGNATLSVSLANASSPTTDDYSLSFASGTYTLTDTTTGSVVGTATSIATGSPGTTIGGLVLTMPSGSMSAGDSFTIQPTRGALNSFALATTNASAIAASSPVLVSASSTNTGTATVTQGSVAAGYSVSSMTLTYNSGSGTLSGFPSTSTISVNGTAQSAGTTSITYNSGDTITVNGVSFTISGTPANGDTFTIAKNTGTDDGRNALTISNLVSSTVFSNSTTLTGAYANYINNIGNSASQLKSANTAQSALVSQIQSAQQSVSGVNLDEEASNLLKYQQLYQANSKVIQTAESMFQTLIGAIQ